MLMFTRALGCACRPPPSCAEITSCTRVLALPLRDHESEMTPTEESGSEGTRPLPREQTKPYAWKEEVGG